MSDFKANQIETKVKEILAWQLGVRFFDITLGSDLVEDLGADSLDIVEILMELESEFEIEYEDEAFAKVQTVKDIVDYLVEESK